MNAYFQFLYFLIVSSGLVFISFPCFSQAKIGVALGANVSTTRFDKAYKKDFRQYSGMTLRDGYNKSDWQAGLYADFPSEENFFSFGAGLMLVNRGYRIDLAQGNTVEQTRHDQSRYLEVPIYLSKYIRNIVIMGGISPSYWLKRELTVTSQQGTYVHDKQFNFFDDKKYFKRFNLAANVGLGYQFPWLEGTTFLLQYHYLVFAEKEKLNFKLYSNPKSSYISLTGRVNMIKANQLVNGESGLYYKFRVGTDLHLGYSSQIKNGMYEGGFPLSPKAGLLIGKEWNTWAIESGLVYIQRKKLFKNTLVLGDRWPSNMKVVLENGLQLKKHLIEIPLVAKKYFLEKYYLTGGMNFQIEFNQTLDAYGAREITSTDPSGIKYDQVLYAVHVGGGMRLPDLFGHKTMVEAIIQPGLNPVQWNNSQKIQYKPVVVGLNLDVHF